MTNLRQYIILILAIGLVKAEIKNKGWWRNTVFYQIYPRSFKDSNDDGIGDLLGIVQKLEHFKQSGIGAIWLSPIFASPLADFGYDISDYRKIDETYGTMADFEYLVKKAHQIGIKVILDFVPNHTSDTHEWFIKSYKNEGKYADYYIWRKGKNNNTSPPNNWLSVFNGPAWLYNGSRNLWFLHQFGPKQPDLNYLNPNVRNEMINVLKFWLGKGVDGFRIDSATFLYENDKLLNEPRSYAASATQYDYTYLNHIYTTDDPRNYDVIQSWRNVLDEWSDIRDEDEKVIMTEAYTSLINTTRFYTAGSNIPFNFLFITNTDASSTPFNFKQTIESWINSMKSLNGDYVANWVVDNHDNPRISTRYPNRSDQMTMLTMILPGIPVTYYGDEIGMTDNDNITWEQTQDPKACNAGKDQFQTVTRDPERTPFQWDNTTNAGFNEGQETWIPINPNYVYLNLKSENMTPQSVYKMYTTLIALKNSSEALKIGSTYIEVFNRNTVLGIFRNSQNDSVSLLINFSNNTTEKVDISSYVDKKYQSAIICTASTNQKNIVWSTKVKLDAVELPPKASYVLQSSTESFFVQSGAPLGVQSVSLVTVALSLTVWLTLNFILNDNKSKYYFSDR